MIIKKWQEINNKSRQENSGKSTTIYGKKLQKFNLKKSLLQKNVEKLQLIDDKKLPTKIDDENGRKLIKMDEKKCREIQMKQF